MKNTGQHWPLDYTLKSKAFNDANISAHHGIIPQQSEFDASTLTDGERKVYEAIVKRYAMQFLPPALFDVSETAFETPYGTFGYKVERVKDLGWRKVFPQGSESEDDADLGKQWLEEGEHVAVVGGTEIVEKQTTPPKPYTEGTLLIDMASVAKYVEDAEIKEVLKRKDDGKKGEHGGIGTTATRSDILEKLKEKGFIELKANKLRSTAKGRDFYNMLPDEIKTVDTTAKWWLLQEAVASGEADPNAIQDSVCEVFNAHKDTAYIGMSLGTEKTVVGKCPKCGQDVFDGKKIVSCSSNRYEKKEDDTWMLREGCGFRMFKTAFGKKLTEAAIKQLLASGKTKSKVKGLKSKKTGKTFEAQLELDKQTWYLKPVFK